MGGSLSSVNRSSLSTLLSWQRLATAVLLAVGASACVGCKSSMTRSHLLPSNIPELPPAFGSANTQQPGPSPQAENPVVEPPGRSPTVSSDLAAMPVFTSAEKAAYEVPESEFNDASTGTMPTDATSKPQLTSTSNDEQLSGVDHSAVSKVSETSESLTMSVDDARAEMRAEVSQGTSTQAKPLPKLTVYGVRPGLGPIKVAVYTTPQSFPDPAKATQLFELHPASSTLETSFAVDGRFAIAIYQDINSDGELNRNRFGIPTEPFAFSNNAMGQRGPPSFEQAAVVNSPDTAAPASVSIQLP